MKWSKRLIWIVIYIASFTIGFQIALDESLLTSFLGSIIAVAISMFVIAPLVNLIEGNDKKKIIN